MGSRIRRFPSTGEKTNHPLRLNGRIEQASAANGECRSGVALLARLGDGLPPIFHAIPDSGISLSPVPGRSGQAGRGIVARQRPAGDWFSRAVRFFEQG